MRVAEGEPVVPATDERAVPVGHLNRSSRNRVGGRDVLDAFRAAVDAHPDRPAIAGSRGELRYRELRARVQALAGRLGPRPGVVGVPAAHAPETVTGLLGVWAAGGGYCPVDPAYPAARRAAMLVAAGCRTRLDPDLRPVPPVPGARLPADHQAPDDQAPDDQVPDGLAYVLFTSGSTGEPKPVLTGRHAIAAATGALRALFELTPADRVLQFASLNWDTCFEEILPTLTSGACLVYHDDAYTGSFPRWLRMVAREQITVLDLPTAFWHELVGYLVEAGEPLPGCVRLVVIGGEAVSPARLADWCRLPTGHARLLNTYGCTETTLVTHAVDLHGPRATGPAGGWHPDSRVPIGQPLPHVMEHLTAGGELLVGGPSLAAGYRGQPAATRERFVTIGGRRYFRTGDRVRRLPDRTLQLLGRLDQQLKVRGVRVDPAEVEAHLAGHPAVRAVAVTGVRVADHTVLAAYVVARPDAAAGLADRLTDYLRARVPAHLVPSRLRLVGELAYTATGKLDRHRLAAEAGLAAEVRP